MLYPHSIRLRGPWLYTLGENDEPSERIELPEGWNDVLKIAAGRALRLRRHFNRPTGLESHERIWLVIDGARSLDSAALNGRSLQLPSGDNVTVEFEVIDFLADRNSLDLTVVGQQKADLPAWREVRLEVRLAE